MRFDTSSCYCIISDYQGQELKRLPAEELSREADHRPGSRARAGPSTKVQDEGLTLPPLRSIPFNEA